MNKFTKLLRNNTFYISAIVVLLVLLLLLGVVYLYNIYSLTTKELAGQKNQPVEEVHKIIELQHGNHILYSDSSDYQRELFSELQTYPVDSAEIMPESIQDYVNAYSRNFVADYLTLSVKDPVYNRIGGRQFIVEPLHSAFDKSDGFLDYYLSRNYFVLDHENDYTELLPQIANQELVSIEPITFDYSDKEKINPDRLGMEGYKLVYNLTYDNLNQDEFIFYDTVTVDVVNWDGIWTVVSLTTNVGEQPNNLISLY